MLPTHALGGMVLALPLAALSPDLAGPALLAGFVGGVVPDLDLYAGHRKLLHYPVYYSVLAAAGVAVGVAVPTSVTVAVAFLLLGAAVHCLADVFGGGLELRPWEATSERAVYDHHADRWIRPRRWVRYDGAPEDLLAAVVLGSVLLAVVDAPFTLVVASTMAVAGAYAAVRRVLPAVATSVVNRFPATARPYLPARYLDGRG